MVKRLRKFLALAPNDRWLLLQAGGLVAGVRLGLWVLPFRRLQALAANAQRHTPKAARAEQALVDKVAWAVRVTSKVVPKASCLTQALSTQILLARLGHPTDVQIGVARDAEGKFEAHAWVISEGRIIIGGRDDLGRYRILPPLESTKS